MISPATLTSISLDPPPPLKWAGGKRWLLPYLRPIYEESRASRLVEPFAGGLAVSLGLRPKRALLNDINPHPINLYRWLKKGLTPTIKMKNDRYVYYRARERFNDLVDNGETDGHESAQLFYFLNRTCFNGLCRFNQQGKFNVPYGKYNTVNYLQDFSVYRTAFKGWQFSTVDFEKLKLKEGDFVYADPPYDVEFTQYAPEGFNWDDQLRLAEWLAGIDSPVVASNQATPRIVKLYRSLGFKIQILDAPRMISCDGNRAKAKEILAVRSKRRLRLV